MNLQHKQWGSPEFSSQPASINESLFRHSGWAARRLQTYQALIRVGTRPQALEAFAECGSALFLNVSQGADDMKLTCNCCRSRWCVPCAQARGRIIANNVKELVGTRADRWMTLTLRHSKTPLTDQLDRLFESFRRLRESTFWRGKVRGGAAFTELKVSDRDGMWHVHLHILVEGAYIDQGELSRKWHAITGDSSIVDIRKIPNVDGIALYLTKYVTKPADSSVYAQPDKLDEMLIALRGRHLCYTIGKWRGMKLSEPPDTGIVWKTVDSIDGLLAKASRGDQRSLRWLEAAARKWPDLAKLRGCTEYRPPPE